MTAPRKRDKLNSGVQPALNECWAVYGATILVMQTSQDRSLEVLSSGCSEKQSPETGNVVQQFEGDLKKRGGK
jgi:hypothetical protein